MDSIYSREHKRSIAVGDQVLWRPTRWRGRMYRLRKAVVINIAEGQPYFHRDYDRLVWVRLENGVPAFSKLEQIIIEGTDNLDVYPDNDQV